VRHSTSPFFLLTVGALCLVSSAFADEKPLKQIQRLSGHRSDVNCAAFSADGRYLATGSSARFVAPDENRVRVWEVQTGKELSKLEGHAGAVLAVAFSPDGQQIASGSSDKTIGLWDWRQKKEIRRFDGHTEPVTSVAFSQDGKRLFSAGDYGSIRVWDTQKGKELQSFKPDSRKRDPYPIFGPALVSQRGIALYDSSRNLVIFDTKKAQILHVMSVQRDVRGRIAMTPDARYALSTGYGNMTCKLWDVENGTEIRSFQAPRETALAIAMAPDGKRAVSNHVDGTVCLWDLEKGEKIASAKIGVQYPNARGAAAISPDGRLAATANHENVALWQLK
jgi:WD40 repeat protein